MDVSLVPSYRSWALGRSLARVATREHRFHFICPSHNQHNDSSFYRVQKWPYFVATGAVHGLCLGLLGLIGDLTASMLKRDAGIKDFGDLIPEHGGILDRVDSFVWTAPYSWLVCAYVIPALKKVAGMQNMI